MNSIACGCVAHGLALAGAPCQNEASLLHTFGLPFALFAGLVLRINVHNKISARFSGSCTGLQQKMISSYCRLTACYQRKGAVAEIGRHRAATR